MRTGLFGKIFGAVLALVVVTDALLVAKILREQSEKLSERIVNHNRLLVNLAARNIETGFSTEQMPYEMLRDLLTDNEAVFWVIARPDGTIYSSSETGFWGKKLGAAIPELGLAVGARSQEVIPLESREDVNVLVEPMKMKEKGVPYVFCLAFSTAEVTELQRRMIWQGVWVTVALVLMMGGVLYVYLSKVLTRPLKKIVDCTRAVAASDWRVSEERDEGLRLPQGRNDELGILAEAFNNMMGVIRQRDKEIQHHLQEVRAARDTLEARVLERTAELGKANIELQAEMERRREAELVREQIQANLIEASRKAGMADVATGVLHNVGNVLNSVNVSTQVVQTALRSSQVGKFLKAAAILDEHAGDLPQFIASDERGKHLPVFLSKLAHVLESERQTTIKELEGLTSNIEHIREIVAMQQSLSRVGSVESSITLGEIIEDALKINHAGLQRHEAALTRDFDPAVTITTDRHRLLQILINLISNAKYAVSATGASDRRIIVRARKDAAGEVEISVIDNGVGIDPGNMTRIFNYGFTTKKQGHGFGLHSSALAARELGGSLGVASDGPGKGAAFTLKLPPRKEAAAAMTAL